MIDPPLFDTYTELENSQWLYNIKQQFVNNTWPSECLRCAQSETLEHPSIRQRSLSVHNDYYRQEDYLIVGGVLDNICNSACQSCNAGLSTKIGNLKYGKNYFIVNNSQLFDQLPQNRIVQIDLNGGEPTASPNYQKILENLPDSVQTIRVNTNGSRMLNNIEKILDKNIQLIITLSFDGTGAVHDYVRWPIIWNDYVKVVEEYQQLSTTYKNLKIEFWTTVHALNLYDMENIIAKAEQFGIPWNYGILDTPKQLNIRYNNSYVSKAKEKLLLSSSKTCNNIAKISGVDLNNQSEIDQFIDSQDYLRNIKIFDYIKD